MKFDLCKVMDREGESDVVTGDVDLSGYKHRGVFLIKEPVQLTAKAENRAGVVSLDCAYRFTLNLTCDRCLTPFTKQVTQQSEHTVVRALNGRDDDDFIVAPDGIVELTELATNDIVLELPNKFLCSVDCKGLCPVCGCNRNTACCNCNTQAIDPRLEALNKFFEDDK
ncbi:MAG: DUF177 domain-containing protein [Angelakisella sp.]|nr:DUF177 domain-containing protein [Angelakisella sp.]